MKKAFLVFLLTFAGALYLFAQSQTYTFSPVFIGVGPPLAPTVPTPCPGVSIYFDTGTGQEYFCSNGIWAKSGQQVSTSISANPSAIDFGTVQSSTQSPVQNVTINNTGSTAITVSSVTLSDATNFTSSNISICNGLLQAGAACVVPFQYSPTAAASNSATVTINSNASGPAPTVALSGTGTASASFLLNVNCAGTGSGIITSNETPPLIDASCNNGNATGTLNASYASGATPILTATATNGSSFTTYSGGGCSTSPCTVTISAATTVTASFSASSPTVNNYYVATTGNDTTGDGSVGNPWATIQKAVNSFVLNTNGAIINVVAGTYSGTTSCGGTTVNVCLNRGGSSSTVRLKIICQATWSLNSSTGCLLRGTPNLGFMVLANNIDVGAIGATGSLGFDISPGANAHACLDIPYQGSATQSTTGNSIHVMGNFCHDLASSVNDGVGVGCPSDGSIIGIDGAHAGHTLGDFEIIANRVNNYGLSSQKGTCNHGHGIYVNTSGAIIEDNIVANAVTRGIQVYDMACNTVIANNTIFNNGSSGILMNGSDGCTAGLNSVVNNISINNGTSGGSVEGWGINMGSFATACGSSTPSLLANNLTYGNISGGTATASCITTSNNRTSDGAGTSTTFNGYNSNGVGDMTLKSGTVAANNGGTTCIAGGQSPCVPGVDFTGTSRPQGSAYDIGAYESF